MKKCILVIGLLFLFLLSSCGGSKWNCNKRYCESPTEFTKDVQAANLVAIHENIDTVVE